MRVQVVEDDEALAEAAAGVVAAAARASVDARGRFIVAFSGGSTPAGMLAALTGTDLPWDRVHVLQVDERVAPDGDPDRNLTGLRQHLLDHVPVPAAQVHAMPVGGGDPEAAARAYAGVLLRVCGDPPVIDLVHLGLGDDGHTASLLPGDPSAAVVDVPAVATGTYEGRRRVTLTLPVLDRARQLLWLVSGASKAPMVRRLVQADPTIPAGRVAQDRAVLLVDTAAAAAR